MLQQSMNTGQTVLPRDSTPCSIYDCSILSPRTSPSAPKVTLIWHAEKSPAWPATRAQVHRSRAE